MSKLAKRLLIIIIVVSLLVGLYFVDPVSSWMVPKCPFRLLTGLNCPACGIQRFFHALLHGEVLTALRYNYYLAYSLPYAALFVVEWLMPQGRTRDRLAGIIESRFAVWFYVVTFLIWFILRNMLKI